MKREQNDSAEYAGAKDVWLIHEPMLPLLESELMYLNLKAIW